MGTRVRSSTAVLAGRRRESSGTVLPIEVARKVEGWVRSGRLKGGMKLPPERELATQLGTSRNVLREGLRVLETRGMIEIRHGVGSFVAELAQSGAGTIPVELDLQVAWLPVAEVLTARRAIECAVVQVAARAHDSLDLAELREVLRETAVAVKSRNTPRFIELDLRFHEMIGRCTHNSVLEAIQAEITRATAAVRVVASVTHAAMRSALQFHEEIAGALASGDGEAAAAGMMLHLIDASERATSGLAHQEDAGRRVNQGSTQPRGKLA
jgi:DNA-binding FadR family transcriptional regulator